MSTSSPTTQYTLAGVAVEFPSLASGTAVKNAARRFETAYGLPSGAAFAFAAANVDPTAERNKVSAKAPTEHLQAIQTPSGQYLLCHPARLWTSLVSADGSNGRSRYWLQTRKNVASHVRPWPIARHHKPAIVDYHPRSLADMIDAVRLSAENIKSDELIMQISQNPRGVWNPPVVVLSRAFVRNEDGSVEERWFLHTIEGSTRVEACHDITATEPGAPLQFSNDSLAHLRRAHTGMADRFATTPVSERSLAVARAAIMPALVVVAAVEEDGNTPIPTGFPDIVNDYVESVHVQPRPFDPIAKYNVRGERFLQKLRSSGRLTSAEVDALLGRDKVVSGLATIRAATLIQTVCDEANGRIVREFVASDSGPNLTRSRRAELIGPLVVRQFANAAPSADAALTRPFIPSILLSSQWTIAGVGCEELRGRCLGDLAAGKFNSPDIVELLARGTPALCATGLLRSDQGYAVQGISQLRGGVDKIAEDLARNAGGVNVLADAIAWADGERKETPRQYDVQGNVKLDDMGDVLHYPPDWDKGNLGIRALARNGGIMPVSESKIQKVEVAPTPEDRYKEMEDCLISTLISAQTVLTDIVSAKDDHNRRLIERLKMRGAKVYQDLPMVLMRNYAKYGPDDPSAFDDDELPGAEPALSLDYEEGDE